MAPLEVFTHRPLGLTTQVKGHLFYGLLELAIVLVLWAGVC